jgi:hypothetical protein
MRVNPQKALKTTAHDGGHPKATQAVYTGRRKLARVFQNPFTYQSAAPVTLA